MSFVRLVGGGKSFGSRGGRTFEPTPATSIAPKAAASVERSITQAGTPTPAQDGNRPGSTALPSRLGGRLLGGLLGAGLFGLLSASGMFGGLSDFASVLGFVTQFALIGGVVWLILNYQRVRKLPAVVRVAASGPGSALPHDMLGRIREALALNGASASSAPTIGPADYNAFEKLLGNTQSAYGREDTETLGALTTPEMLSYFSQDLAENAKKGVRNEVAGVKLIEGDLAESWREAGTDYATVALRYSLIDAMIDRATGRVISGDRGAPRDVTEVWTFRRDDRDPAQGWHLSAIQQV
jgi:predicted lipid-binding transport protein (Tim44 family)